MPDREKLLKGLKCCIKSDRGCFCPDDCPYDDNDEDRCETLIKLDAIELLKEQEPVEPIKPIDVDDSFTYLCSNCKGELFCGDRIRDKFCSTCGRLVKWDA